MFKNVDIGIILQSSLYIGFYKSIVEYPIEIKT